MLNLSTGQFLRRKSTVLHIVLFVAVCVVYIVAEIILGKGDSRAKDYGGGAG